MTTAALIPISTPQYLCFANRTKPFISLRNLLLIDTVADDQTSAETPLDSAARRLILLRHTKSSWENPSLRDHDRPLSKSGRSDAVKLGQKLERLGWIPQLILSSDAQRTRETLKIMQEQVRAFVEAEVQFISSFYSVAAMDGQTAEHLQQTICKYSRNEILTIMCMGHNRGWEEAASMFSGASIELKTCNAALLEASGNTWEEFNKFGQPVGRVACELQSYIAVLARQYVKVSYKTWRDVPVEVKDLIWESVTLSYKIDDKWKAKCMESASTKWRGWKSRLYTEHIVPNENNPGKLHIPPPDSGIQAVDWGQFVISRMSNEFKTLSEDQK